MHISDTSPLLCMNYLKSRIGMKKILQITSRADYGGGPEHLKHLISGLNSSFEFFIAAPADKPYFEIFKKYGTCIEIQHRKFSVWSLISLLKTVNKHRIDIIHSHGKGAGIYSRILGFMTGKPVVHTFHGFHYTHLNLFYRWFYLGIEKLFAYSTDVFISVSESEKNSCLNAGIVSHDRIVVVLNGVQIPTFRKRALTKKETTFVNISRLSWEKGMDVLIDIIKALSQKFRDFQLLIIGDGPERVNLERKVRESGIEKYVSFLGFRHDVSNLLEQADIYITASRGEGMPLTVLEAMAASLPVVASSVVGNVDVVVHGENGFLFNINNPDEASEYLLKLINDNALYDSMSIKAYRTIADKHSLAKMCAEIANIYNKF